jgi:hypothetical protein
MNETKQINEFSDIELQHALINLTINAEVIKNNITLIVNEILQRQEAAKAKEAAKETKLVLPKLFKTKKEEIINGSPNDSVMAATS